MHITLLCIHVCAGKQFSTQHLALLWTYPRVPVEEQSKTKLKKTDLFFKLLISFQEVIQNFERNMQDLVSSFIENLQGFLAQARDAENVHNEKMMEIAQVTLDKVAKSEIDDEISEDLRMVSSEADQYLEEHGRSGIHFLKISFTDVKISATLSKILSHLDLVLYTKMYEWNQCTTAQLPKFRLQFILGAITAEK